MKFAAATTLAALATAGSALAYSLPDGFPNPSAQQLMRIQIAAGGTLPNTALPTSLPAAGVTAFQVIAVNELSETFYFNQLLENVENNKPGFQSGDLQGLSKAYVVKSLKRIIKQEEIHAIGANAILASAGQKTIGPCQYKFPSKDFKSAIQLAATFTDLVLGTLQEVQGAFAASGDAAGPAVVQLIGSIIGQEGEQDGAYRLINRKVPSASPFLTAGSGAFAFNAVRQLFIKEGTCPSSSNVQGLLDAIPAFAPLSLASSSNTPQSFQNTTLTFTTTYNGDASHIAYISGQNTPVVREIQKGSGNTFKAAFPAGSGFSNGLTIAALVNSAGPFATAADVAAATVAGPGLIEID